MAERVTYNQRVSLDRSTIKPKTGIFVTLGILFQHLQKGVTFGNQE